MKTPGDEEIDPRDTSLVIRFPGRRNVLATSWLGGGYREDLQAVFNHQIPLAACEACHSGTSVKEYLGGVARSLSLDPEKACGLVTRAEMKNAAIVTESYRELFVSAIVTAGIDKNGGRAGDPASYYENGSSFEPVGGTINTILIIGADLPDYAMARAILTATEAKTAALQQLVARSIYSTGIATGSGTDMIAIVCDPGSALRLSDAGKHAKLGELIGRAVITATTDALERETGLCAESQRNVLVRLLRYGITDEVIWNAAVSGGYVENTTPEKRERFLQCIRALALDPERVARVAAALHLLDEAGWGLIPGTAARNIVIRLLQEEGDEIYGAEDRAMDCVPALLARLVTGKISSAPALNGKDRRDEEETG
nr:adenosylcobinamide amidohydrolase [uncultured Methanoregula sp.]